MTKMTFWKLLSVLALVALAFGCAHEMAGGSADVPPDTVYVGRGLTAGVSVIDLNGYGQGTNGLPPEEHAGAFYNDGGDGDVRARTETFFNSEEGRELIEFDEIVVVERSDGTRENYGPDQVAALRAVVEGSAKGRPLPLERTDVRGKVALNIASVGVTQVYSNPYAEKIEAVYVFPLPQDAAVSDFVMQIGERRIRGIVREREEAQRIYEQARAQGYQASLLSQERPNIFTQRVANIEPGKRIDIEITYFQTLEWRDGAFQMVVPTVVGPRFNPSGSKDGVGAVAAGHEGSSGQATEVSYVSGDDQHRLTLEVELDAGMALGELTCDSHPVTIDRGGANRAKVALRDGVDVPNRDFVLRFAPKGEGLQGAVAVHRDAASGDGWFTMLVQPPLHRVEVPPQPREMIFVVDCSGSMSGEPIAVCKRAIRRCLDRLGPEDSFQVIRFSGSASSLGTAPVPATADNLRKGLAFVDDLEAGGGTMMERGIVAALQPPIEDGRRRIVTFMTDGYIGDERDILAAVHEHVGEARIFSFGVGSSTNRYLMERMASIGRGVAAFINIDDSGSEQIDALFERLERPALADLRIDWDGAVVEDLEPRRLPDLFVGRPLVLHGRIEGAMPETIRVSGRVGDRRRSFDLKVGDARQHPAMIKLWARSRIRSLNDEMCYSRSPDEQVEQIRAIALEHGLASAYTSFIAVDGSYVTEGDHGTTVVVPAPMPRGVRYDTSVSGSGN